MNQCNIVDNNSAAIYVAAPDNPSVGINARENWWGVSDSAAIEAKVRHKLDLSTCPLVRYVPFARKAFDFHDTVFTAVDEETAPEIPREYGLHQNYPNPFNLATRIEFSLPRPTFVGIQIINIEGRQIRTLVSEQLSAGRKAVTWNGTDDSGHEVASGVYFCRLVTRDFTDTKKILLLK